MIIFILYLSVIEYTIYSIVMGLYDYLYRYLKKRPPSHEHNITVIQ